MNKITVKVPATSGNLGPAFDIAGLALGLYNTFTVEPLPRGLQIILQGPGSESIETTEENLIYRAMSLLFASCGKPVPGCRLTINTQIPSSRGLGSSASAVVGGLVAANAWLDNPADTGKLLNLATSIEGHPDNVAPALMGGLVIAARVDDRISAIELDVPDELKFVVAIPSFELSTRNARKVVPMHVPLHDALFNIGRTAFLLAGLSKKDWPALSVGMQDALHQPYRQELIPGMKDVIQAARLAGAIGCVLSGAGPSLLAITIDRTDEIVAAMEQAWLAHGIQSKAVILPIDREGAQVVEHQES